MSEQKSNINEEAKEITWEERQDNKFVNPLLKSMTMRQMLKEIPIVATLSQEPVFVGEDEWMNDLDTEEDLEIIDEAQPREKRNSPVMSAFACVGITSAYYDVEPRMCNIRRDISEITNEVMMYEQELVIDIEMPTVGIEDLMRSHLASLQFNGSANLIQGSGHTSMAIAGIREKQDGTEVIQFVIATKRGRQAFLWTCQGITKVHAQGPAYYERIERGGQVMYVLISGEAAHDIPVERYAWQQPTHENLSQIVSCSEGVVLNINAMHYRVKNIPTITVNQVSSDMAMDFSNRRYKLQEPSEKRGMIDVELYALREVRYIRERKDRDFPDTAGKIDMLSKIALVREVQEVFPSMKESVHSRKEAGEELVYPACPVTVTTSVFRAMHRRYGNWGPYDWLSNTKERDDYAMSIVRTIAKTYGRVDPHIVQQYLYQRDKYANGQRIIDIARPKADKAYPFTLRGIPMWITTCPLQTTVSILRFYVREMAEREDVPSYSMISQFISDSRYGPIMTMCLSLRRGKPIRARQKKCITIR